MNRSASLIVIAFVLVASACGNTQNSTTSPPQTTTVLSVADGALPPGRYSTDVQGYRYTFTVSGSGWTSGGDAVLQGDHDNDPPDFGGLFMWADDPGLFTEPCQWQGTYVKPGSTAADLATALADLDGFEASEPTNVTVGGHQGKRLQLTVPADVNFASCQDGQYRSFDGRWYQVPGQVDDIRVVDLDGSRRLIRTTYDPGTSAAVRTELEQLIDTMEIEHLAR